MITLSSVKNERSCICAEHNRLPNEVVTMRYNSTTDRFTKEAAKVSNNVVRLGSIDYTFPAGASHHQVAFDTLGEYVKTWFKDGKGYIDYMDNLQAARVVKEVECTSLSCGISTVNTYKDHVTEVLVAYTLANGEVYILEQSGRFQTPKLYTKITGASPMIRVCGPTTSNRFLIRFFSKIKLV